MNRQDLVRAYPTAWVWR